MSLEQIVRPFVGTDVSHPRQIVVSVESDNNTNMRLEIGREGGEVKTLSGNSTSTLTKYMDQKAKEISRVEVEKRIENPDDPEDFVDTKEPKEITDEFGGGLDYQKTKRKYEVEDEE